jgi:peptidoglycan/xylan/chitin deacetylase (PgdA/CDA1 family)
MSKLIAFMYHGIGAPADAASGERYTVTVPEFEEQLSVLAGNDARVQPPENAIRGGVLLTFDDGEASVVTQALPRLASRGLRAALFMTTDWIGRRGYLNANGLRELQSAGWLIGSHGHTHRFLNTLSRNQLDAELCRSRDVLGNLFGTAPTHLSLPGGRMSRRVREQARAVGFDTLWTSKPGVMQLPLRGSLLRRTAIRRGFSRKLFIRLAAGVRSAHMMEQLTMASRGVARQVIGNNRYHRLTAEVLERLGRK